MKKYLYFLIALLAFSCAEEENLATQQANDEEAAIELPSKVTTETTNICKNQAVPPGFVIIRESSNPSCPRLFGGRPNQWTITRARAFQNVCRVSQIPTGFVIIRASTNPGCPPEFGGRPNQWFIDVARSPQTICKVSRIPPGFVITGERTSPNCPREFGGRPNQWTIERL